MSSSSDPSTPIPPATPSTPPHRSPGNGSDPSTPQAKDGGPSPMKMRLPTPSSFSHRVPSTPTSPNEEPGQDAHSPEIPAARVKSMNLYTIPQKMLPSDVDPPSSSIRRGPPSALTLQPLRMPLGPGSSLSPFSRSVPVSAPLSKVATLGAARRLSESRKGGSPALEASALSRSKSTSIWAEGLPSPRASGWISPALGTGRSMSSTGTASRPRGLQVAILNDEKKELILGDVPHHPGTPSMLALTVESAAMERDKARSLDITGVAQPQKHEIILCRYYHTPGLTCTSRPCRFVHALESLNLPATVDPPSTAPMTYKVLSPHQPDPTKGTFAQAQQLKSPKSAWRNSVPSGLSGSALGGLDRSSLLSPTIPAAAGRAPIEVQQAESVLGGMEPGQRVVLSTDDGVLNGTVFLMSGGGKGPAGKSKAKYKTIPCKDYAAGYCPYGDYCSFIHQTTEIDPAESAAMIQSKSADLLTSVDEADNGIEHKDLPSPPILESPRRRRNSTGSYATAVVHPIRPKFEPTISAIEDASSETSSLSRRRTEEQETQQESNNLEMDREADPGPAPQPIAPEQHRAWLQAVPRSILVPSVKVDAGQFDKLKPALSAFAPPFQQRPVVVDLNGELKSTDTIPKHPETAESQGDDPSTQKSAWSRGPPASLKSLSLKKVSSSTLSSGKLAPPPSAVSMFGTESDPATPWDPALRQQQINAMRQTAWDPTLTFPPRTLQNDWPSVAQAGERLRVAANISIASTSSGAPESTQVHPEYAESQFVPPTPLATPLHPPMIPPYYHGAQYTEPSQAWPYPKSVQPGENSAGAVWYPPPPVSYPWGVPMSPVHLPEFAREEQKFKNKGQAKDKTPRPRNHRRGMSTPADLLKLPGGLGVMWTPAGWAVQDAAMKLNLRLAEMNLAGQGAEGGKEKKSYYKSRQCIFFSQGYCPHGDQCSYRHDPPSRTSSPSDPATDLLTPAPLPTSSNGSPTKRKPIPILPCKFYNSGSGCSRGSECTFLHAMVVPQFAPLVDRPRPWRTKQCRHWLVGRCTLGDACHFAHVDADGNDEHAKPRLFQGFSGPKRPGDGYGGYSGYENGYGLVHGPAGNGWGGYAAETPLSEENVRVAMRDIKRYNVKEESDDEDDDLEIVTEDTSVAPSSHAFSPTRQWGGP